MSKGHPPDSLVLDEPVWVVMYLHDWDDSGRVYPCTHGYYEDEQLAYEYVRWAGWTEGKNASGPRPSYWVEKTYKRVRREQA